MMSVKMATPDLLKIRVYWNEVDEVIHNLCPWHRNKTLSFDSNYIVDVVMWPKFDNSSIFMREVIKTSIL